MWVRTMLWRCRRRGSEPTTSTNPHSLCQLGVWGFVSGFRVDLDALAAVADGVKQVLAELSAHKLSDLDCDRAAFGHHKLAVVVDDFCSRWRHGISNLTQDGAEIASRLTESLQTYAQ